MKVSPSLSLAIITLIGIFVSCGPRKTKSAVVEDVRKDTLAVVKDVVYPSDGFVATGFKYGYFGRIGVPLYGLAEVARRYGVAFAESCPVGGGC